MIGILDDDQVFADTLVRRLSSRGLASSGFYTVYDLLACHHTFEHLILDMNLGHMAIIQHLPDIRQKWPQSQILILTGYASIASTVAAIKQGADDYLTKPIDFVSLLNRLDPKNTPPKDTQAMAVSQDVLSPAQLEWEHIHRVLHDHEGNISAAARALGMHRRTLQRKLQKKPPHQSSHSE